MEKDSILAKLLHKSNSSQKVTFHYYVCDAALRTKPGNP